MPFTTKYLNHSMACPPDAAALLDINLCDKISSESLMAKYCGNDESMRQGLYLPKMGLQEVAE